MKGGRPRTRSLGETLLRRRLNKEQHQILREAFLRLTDRERSSFREHFGFSKDAYVELDVYDFSTRKRRPSGGMQHILKKFRLEARYLLATHRPKPLKDYVVERVPKSDYERDAWEQRHPDMPFVATRPKKVYFTELPEFAYFDRKFARGDRLTPEQIRDGGGSRYTAQVAEAVVEFLASKHGK